MVVGKYPPTSTTSIHAHANTHPFNYLHTRTCKSAPFTYCVGGHHYIKQTLIKNTRAEEITQRLRALVALTENQDLVPSTHSASSSSDTSSDLHGH